MITFSSYQLDQIPRLMEIWNEILRDGLEFARETPFVADEFAAFLEKQTAVTCIYADGVLAGFYILHPNDEGRRAHVANASFAMDKSFRGRGLGKRLVSHCLTEAKAKGFRAMQFIAVVADNAPALQIYEALGFQQIGIVPEGFRAGDDSYRDLIVMYRLL